MIYYDMHRICADTFSEMFEAVEFLDLPPNHFVPHPRLAHYNHTINRYPHPNLKELKLQGKGKFQKYDEMMTRIYKMNLTREIDG
jgi:hypothetical protein